MYEVILSFLTAFGLTFLAIPPIIHIARVKGLTDEPGERRAHTESTPSLGGIGIFAGVLFSVIFWTPYQWFSELQYVLGAMLIIFLIGAKDDIVPLDPMKKLLGQFIAALILVFRSDVRLTSFQGLLGFYEIPEWFSYVFSVFTILVIVNAFNLIDGINGLAGSIGLLIAASTGVWFMMVNHVEYAIISFALVGAITAFLKFNLTPAQIFMGDTGALTIGLLSAVLSIKFIEFNRDLQHPFSVHSAPVVAMSIIILPLFDLLRVFTIRIAAGRSPFSADRNHLHHLLLDLGLSHLQATSVLAAVNVSFIVMAFALQEMNVTLLLVVIFGLALSLTWQLERMVKRRMQKAQTA